MTRQIANPNTFFAIVAVFTLLAAQGVTYGQTVSIDPATIESPAAGEQLTVNISITSGMNVAGYQLTVTFDSTALSYVNIANGDYLPAGAFATAPIVTDTSVTLGAAGLPTASGVPTADGDGTLATVTFTVVEAKDSAIGLTNVLISDATATAIDVTIQGGTVTGPATETPTEPETPMTPETPEMPEMPEMPEAVEFKVTLTNLTMGAPAQGGQIFSPPIFVTHGHGFSIGASGEAASAALTALAETGNHAPLAALAGGSDAVSDVVAFPAPPSGVVIPGGTVTTMVSTSADAGYLSLATMLVQTNDGIVLANSLPLFDEDGNPRSFTMDLISYDAGTEDNNELATHVPGPPFEGGERAPTEGGVITLHPGIAGVGDVGATFGWTEPTATVTVEAVVEMPEMPAEPVDFEVMLTNLTMGVPAQGGQIFSPPIFVTHGHGFSIGASGEAASAALTALAETGNHAPLAALAGGSDAVSDVVAFPAPPSGVVIPGGTVTTMVSTSADAGYLSLATMLVQTNDGIVLANSLPLFDEDGNPRSFTMDLISYDAGTEDNNELATHVPGPPFEGGERAPTEGGVITLHPGIAGVGDVGATFGWTEPTATLTVMPVIEMPPVTEPPKEPEIPTEPTGMFEMALASGLNMISLPLMPAEPYTASSFAEMIGATVVIQLDTARQEFVGFTADQEGDGFAIEGGQGYIVNVPGGGTVTFTGTAWNNAAAEDAAAAPGIQLPSTAWAFVLSGDLLKTEAGVSYTVVATNHRTGEIATRQLSSDHKEFNAVWADLSRKSVIEAGDTLEVTLIDQWDNIVSGPFTHRVGVEDLRKAYLSLPLTVGDVHPAATILGQNFPNPFNPETWIPYQLEDSADVALQIYDMSGSIVRTIDLGFKSRGFYMTRSTAAYWDGRNNMGEQVASGVYFYSLQTSGFSGTRKMLILK